MPRQFVTCVFRPGDRRAYTYHNDGQPVDIGDKVLVEGPRNEGKVAVTVSGLVDQPPPFATKGILGKAPDVQAEKAPE